MRINSTIISSNKPTRSISSDQVSRGKATFSTRTEASQSIKRTVSKDSPISHEQLMALASDLKSGRIDKEEAHARFVSAAVEGSVQGTLSVKDREAMAKDIADLFADVPDFMSKLQENLRALV